MGLYAGVHLPLSTLIALLVCLIPTTIGGLLSAIGIAGMDRNKFKLSLCLVRLLKLVGILILLF